MPTEDITAADIASALESASDNALHWAELESDPHTKAQHLRDVEVLDAIAEHVDSILSLIRIKHFAAAAAALAKKGDKSDA